MTGAMFTPGPAAKYLGLFDNRVQVTIDGTAAAWNTVASHEVFTVTGLVYALVVYRVTETLAAVGAAEIRFGREGDTDAMTASQVVTALVAGKFVLPGSTVGADFGFPQYMEGGAATLKGASLVDGLDLGYEVTVDALTDGTIQAICYWSPVSSDGLVVAGAGGAL